MTRCADAPTAASTISTSSISASLSDSDPSRVPASDWTTKTSAPRTDSS